MESDENVQDDDCVLQEPEISTITLDNSTIVLDSTIGSPIDESAIVVSDSGNDETLNNSHLNVTSLTDDNEENEKFLFHIQFNERQLFSEISTLISSKIRDSLSEIEKSVTVKLNRENNRIDFYEQNRNDVFMVDTLPTEKKNRKEIPDYDKVTETLLNLEAKVNLISGDIDKPRRNGCWNCGGDHNLRDCKEPRNMANINRAKQLFTKLKTERYHLDAEQRYSHFAPGKIGANLKDALGLRKRELPLYIYKMRLYGYPPGWLEEAKVSHSGLSLFTSTVSYLTLDFNFKQF